MAGEGSSGSGSRSATPKRTNQFFATYDPSQADYRIQSHRNFLKNLGSVSGYIRKARWTPKKSHADQNYFFRDNYLGNVEDDSAVLGLSYQLDSTIATKFQNQTIYRSLNSNNSLENGNNQSNFYTNYFNNKQKMNSKLQDLSLTESSPPKHYSTNKDSTNMVKCCTDRQFYKTNDSYDFDHYQTQTTNLSIDSNNIYRKVNRNNLTVAGDRVSPTKRKKSLNERLATILQDHIIPKRSTSHKVNKVTQSLKKLTSYNCNVEGHKSPKSDGTKAISLNKYNSKDKSNQSQNSDTITCDQPFARKKTETNLYRNLEHY